MILDLAEILTILKLLRLLGKGGGVGLCILYGYSVCSYRTGDFVISLLKSARCSTGHNLHVALADDKNLFEYKFLVFYH